MSDLRRELRQAVRVLSRSRTYTVSVLVVLALGIGVSIPVLTLAERGVRRPAHAMATVVEGVGDGLQLPTTSRLASGGLGSLRATQTVAQIQRGALDELLRVLGALGLAALGIAAVNAVILLLGRATTRRREMAVRAALGAGRARLARTLLGEGALLALAGVLLGLVGAGVGVWWLRESWPGALVRWSTAAQPWLLAVMCGLPLIGMLAASLLPARIGARADLHTPLTADARATAGPGEGRVRNVLIIGAVAMSLVLLTGAGLLLRGFLPAGGGEGATFDPRNTLTLQLDIPADRAADDEARAAFFRTVRGRVEALPGVVDTSIASNGAWVGLGTLGTVHVLTGTPARPGVLIPAGSLRPVRQHAVSSGFFDALGVVVLRGREVAETDDSSAPGVVVVNETFANRFFFGTDPIGKQIQFGGVRLGGDWYTVVGVVDDLRAPGLGTGSEPDAALYLSALQHPPLSAGLAARTAGDPLAAADAVRGAIRGAVSPLASEELVSEVMTMEERLARYLSPLRWIAFLFAAVAFVAVLLAAVGLYAIVRYDVERRTREIGVRVALGARRDDIIRLVVGRSVRLAVLGAAVGLIGALSLARLLELLFLGVSPLDPLTYAVTAALLLAVALLASYQPARGALRVDPAVAFRAE